MPLRLQVHSDASLTQAFIQLVIDEHTRRELPRLEKLWAYYRNPLAPAGLGGFGSRGGRWYSQAQEAGLPARIVGAAGRSDGSPSDDRSRQRREAVIENDIGWRVQAMVDFMFGKPLTIRSTASDPALRSTIDTVLAAVWERSGGIALLQDMALLGHVFGHVDLSLKMSADLAARAMSRPPLSAPPASAQPAIAQWLDHVRIEVIDPRRGIAIQDPRDYRRLRGYLVSYVRRAHTVESAGLLPRITGSEPAHRLASHVMTEVVSPRAWQVYQDGALVWEQPLAVLNGALPVVHVQNIAQPLEYTGMSEVEPLIGLQDELNTRLSDRASRVTLQSFKMYLARGVEGFENARVGPGQIWSTTNEKASVEAFGGDAASPSEEHHIREVREALDKISGIPPLASGVVQAKIGNLSSANALRITLMAVLSKTARKRVTYGAGIARMCELVLRALDGAGILATDPAERHVHLEWPDPLPDDVREQMFAAEAKARLGVRQERILAELGYGPDAARA